MRVATGGLDLRIERTDLDPTEDDMNASWLATTPSQGFIGQGTTDLIRRQLDLIDALAPGTMLGFAMHPATKPEPNDDSQREASVPQSESAVGQKKRPIIEISSSPPASPDSEPPAPPSPEQPVTPDRRVRPPLYDHSGSPELHLSPDYPAWFRGWDALNREHKECEEREAARKAESMRTESRADRAARRRREKQD
jgi:hypothetical protein